MPFLATTQNCSSRVLSTFGPNLVALKQFAPNSPSIALNALTMYELSEIHTHRVSLHISFKRRVEKNNIDLR